MTRPGEMVCVRGSLERHLGRQVVNRGSFSSVLEAIGYIYGGLCTQCAETAFLTTADPVTGAHRLAVSMLEAALGTISFSPDSKVAKHERSSHAGNTEPSKRISTGRVCLLNTPKVERKRA